MCRLFDGKKISSFYIEKRLIMKKEFLHQKRGEEYVAFSFNYQ
jgi:hypothetical protein